MKYTGSCHCGKVRFEAEMESKQAMAWNCSICLDDVGLNKILVTHFDGKNI